jgi:hypothetical protein
MAREVCNFDSCYSLIDYQIHIETGRNMCRDVLVSGGTNPYVGHGRLIPDVVRFDDDTGISLPHVTFATPAYVIRRCERPFYEWTNMDFSEPSQECSLVC